jgi:hypothetical protein
MNQLPRYVSHKIVSAAKIAAIDFGERLDLMPAGTVVEVGAKWIEEKRAEVGGYYVVYEDGYTSYSPAEAFEKGYTALPQSHEQRVIAEKAELDARLGRLLAFFQSETFAGLSEAERSRLRNQARFMDGYAAVLQERIDAFGA